MAQSLQDFAAQVANQFGIDPAIFTAQIQQESSFNPSATNGNAVGIAQFMPQSVNEYAPDNRLDPYASITAAAQFDASLLAKNGGDYTGMLTSYGTLSNKAGSSVGPGSSVYQKFQDIISGISDNAVSALTNGAVTNAQSVLSNAQSGTPNPIAAGFKWIIDYLTSEGANISAIVVGVIFMAIGSYGLVTKSDK